MYAGFNANLLRIILRKYYSDAFWFARFNTGGRPFFYARPKWVALFETPNPYRHLHLLRLLCCYGLRHVIV